jgi:hypothetical protein
MPRGYFSGCMAKPSAAGISPGIGVYFQILEKQPELANKVYLRNPACAFLLLISLTAERPAFYLFVVNSFSNAV